MFVHFQNFFIGILLSICRCENTRVSQLSHIAIYEIKVAAVLGRNTVEVLKLPNVVCGHPTVLPCGSVPAHAACVISSQQSVNIELDKIILFLACGEQGAHHALFPPHKPGFKGVFNEFKGLLLNIRKARFFKVANHVGRHSENSSNFIYLKLSCFKELRLFRGNTDGRVFHALFKHSDLSAVGTAAELRLPRFTNL